MVVVVTGAALPAWLLHLAGSTTNCMRTSSVRSRRELAPGAGKTPIRLWPTTPKGLSGWERPHGTGHGAQVQAPLRQGQSVGACSCPQPPGYRSLPGATCNWHFDARVAFLVPPAWHQGGTVKRLFGGRRFCIARALPTPGLSNEASISARWSTTLPRRLVRRSPSHAGASLVRHI